MGNEYEVGGSFCKYGPKKIYCRENQLAYYEKKDKFKDQGEFRILARKINRRMFSEVQPVTLKIPELKEYLIEIKIDNYKIEKDSKIELRINHHDGQVGICTFREGTEIPGLRIKKGNIPEDVKKGYKPEGYVKKGEDKLTMVDNIGSIKYENGKPKFTYFKTAEEYHLSERFTHSGHEIPLHEIKDIEIYNLPEQK